MDKYAIDATTLERFPNLVGVIAPALRIKNFPEPKVNKPGGPAGLLRDLDRFIESFDYRGEYHNVEHFHAVVERFHADIDWLIEKYPDEYSDFDYFVGEVFGRGHDCVHNAHREGSDRYRLTIEEICELYGLEPTNQILSDLLDALNFGIAQDNEINSGTRPLATSFNQALHLSDEEASAIVVDAFSYRNGIDLQFRYTLSGMILITELARSLKDGKPGFRYPRTQLELLGKLADVGNFCEDVSQWAQTSARVNVEEFANSDLARFVEIELGFIKAFIRPTLDAFRISKLRDSFGNSNEPRIPECYFVGVKEKEALLLDLKKKLETKQPLQTPFSVIEHLGENDPIRKFAEIIRDALSTGGRTFQKVQKVKRLFT